MKYPPKKTGVKDAVRWFLWTVLVSFTLHSSPVLSGEKSSALIRLEGLAELQNAYAEKLRVIEMSDPEALKEAGWVVDYEGLPGMLPPAKDLSQAASKIGLIRDDVIVIVPAKKDIWGYASAMRLFWTLRMMGHEKLFFLEGEIPEGLAQHSKPDGKYSIEKLPGRWVTNMGGVYAGDDYQTPPLDIRDKDRSEGYTTHPLVHDPGTIYDALNIPPIAFFENGRLKSKAQLEELMGDVIGKPPGPVVVFSDTGLRAAIAWFAIHEIMGLKDVRIYDGGYIDWDAQGGETYDERNDMGDALG